MKDEPEIIEGQTVIEDDDGDNESEGSETVIAESIGDEDADESEMRTIRVYDKGRGDFQLQIPKRSTVTFGYFNPGTPRYGEAGDRYSHRPSDVARATALRIYERGPKSSQLACFLDVEGFRDLTLTLTRLRQRVVIESNFENDGDGNIKWGGAEQRALNAANEDDAPF